MFRIILLVLLIVRGCNTQKSPLFYRDIICDVNGSINRGCSKEAPGLGHTPLTCVRHCMRQSSCVGAGLYENTNKCLLHESCAQNRTACGLTDSTHQYYTTTCVRGQWNEVTRTCECAIGCYGTKCEKTIRICKDLIGLGYKKGAHKAYIDPLQNGNAVQVICSANAPEWSALWIFTNYGRIGFNRDWSDYVNGYFNSDEEFWVGLETLHILCTSFNYNRLFLKMHFNSSVNPDHITGTYYDFTVSSGSDGYSFTFSRADTPSGDYSFENCFEPLKDVPFATRDKNGGGGDCASLVGSGWWHPPSCNQSCNLLGRWVDWDNIPVRQRWSVPGVNMDIGLPPIQKVSAYVVKP